MDNIQAKKYLGQNFLRNRDILKKIVGDESLWCAHVVEVGPGPGDLTNIILDKSPLSLSLIEIDYDMVWLLLSRFSKNNIHLYWSDVLKVNILPWNIQKDNINGIQLYEKKTELTLPSYHIYGNIPYYITSPIIHHFFYDVSLQPEVAIFTMQKEVADRILARDNKHSVLSLACQLIANIEKVCDINPNNFVPAPKVWSTCLKFTIKNDIPQKESKKILKIIQKWFSQKRKKLISNLENNGYDKSKLRKAFEELAIDENIRAEDLSLTNWIELNQSLS